MTLGKKIQADDFNNFRKRIAAIWGNGGTNPNNGNLDPTYGYGQLLQSSEVSVDKKIGVTEWTTLIYDIVNTWILQNGLTTTQPLTTILNRKVIENNKVKTSSLVVRSISSNVCSTNINLNITISQISENQVCHSSTDHGLSVGYVFTTTSNSNGFNSSFTYYVISIISSTQFLISRTPDGDPVSLTNGTGLSITGVGFLEITHGFSVGDTFVPTVSGNGFSSGVTYYVRSVPDSSRFTVSTTVTGSSPSLTNGTNLSITGTSSAQPYAYLDSIITNLDSVNNRFQNNVSIVEYYKTDKNQAISFGIQATGIIELNFKDSDQARWFFNSGGKITISTTFISSLQTNQSLGWQNLIADVNNTPPFLSGNPNASVNFYNLSNSFKDLVNKSSSGIYQNNRFRITTRTPGVNNSSGTAKRIQFSIILDDGYLDPGPPNPTDIAAGTLGLVITATGPEFLLTPAGSGSFIKHFPSLSADGFEPITISAFTLS